MNIKTFFSIIVAAFIFISCEREVEFNGSITNPLVVVNSFVTPDSTVSAYISMSRFFLKDSTEFRDVNNADVSLWVNGTFKDKLTCDSTGTYSGTYKPINSDKIKLIVDVPGMQQVSASTEFIEAPVILSVDTQKVVLSKEIIWNSPTDTLCIKYNYKVNYKLKFTDNGDQRNYYRLIVRKTSFEADWNSYTNKIDTVINSGIPNYIDFDFTDVVSGNTNDPLVDDGTSPVGVLLSNTNNIFHVFSDNIFNGKTYTLHFSTTITKNVSKYALNRLSDVKHEVYISLQSISKDYYLYLMTRSASYATDYFSEPVKVYNNINGGIGILGSYTNSNIVKIDLP